MFVEHLIIVGNDHNRKNQMFVEHLIIVGNCHDKENQMGQIIQIIWKIRCS